MKTNDEWIQHISTNVFIDGKTGCWNWKRATRKDGYVITWYNGSTDYIHRVSYRVFKGDFDSNFIIRHKCDNPSCCNPDHLLIGSDQDNSTDMVSRDRQAKGSLVGTAKLTEEIVVMIRSLSGSSQQLAKFFDCSKTTIKDIRNNKIWKHV